MYSTCIGAQLEYPEITGRWMHIRVFFIDYILYVSFSFILKLGVSIYWNMDVY